MMRFNKNFGLVTRFFGGGKTDPSLVIKTEPAGDNEIRDKIHLSYLTEDDKSYLYEQSRVRKTFSLYNVMRMLPNSVTNFVSSFTADPKVLLKSDNLYLPRLTKNGVPVFDSLRNSKFVNLWRNLQAIAPIYFLIHLHFPGVMTAASLVGYIGIYRPIISRLANGFVVKMELVPQTEQLLVQTVGPFGCIRTKRIKTDDIEIFDKSKLNFIFYKFSRSFIDSNLIFKVKSTGQLLFFDPEGVWYEDGINHELLI